MSITINKQSALDANSDCIVLPLANPRKLCASLKAVDQASKGYISALIKSGDVCADYNKATMLFKLPNIKADRVLIIGMKKEKFTPAQLEETYKLALKELEKSGANSAQFYLHEAETNQQMDRHIHIATIALLNAQYRFAAYKSKKPRSSSIKTFSFGLNGTFEPSTKTAQQALANAQSLVKGITLCRELGNLPGNVCTPTYLAEQAKKMAKAPRVSVKVIDEKSFASMGMGAFLSVAKGSEQAAKLICVNYQGGKKDEKPHVLVGKGITFDTGGISLKPGAAMDEMKFDMCGAASVLGTMSAVIDAKLKLNVIALVAAAENMPSGGASKPGDIVTSMNGLTIEILNTDAEGRLVLCDTLTYAEQFKPASVIDVATLTGACVVALGSHASALYSNNDKLAASIQSAGEQAWDRVWPMPLWPEYQEQLKSPFADLANIGGPKAGSITAACFLSKFTEKYPWAHLDIAGTAWHSAGSNKGATGRPVPLLFEYLNRLAS